MKDKIFWENLIGYKFIQHYPFSLEELSVNYIDIRSLLVILRKIILRNDIRKNSMNYTLELNGDIKTDIVNQLKEYRHAGLGISLEQLLKILSKKAYWKGGTSHEMFEFQEPKPYHKVCGKFLENPIKRVCFKCHKILVPQQVHSKETYERMDDSFREKLTCPECRKSFFNKNLNCSFCNPEDLSEERFLQRYPDENPKKAYIFPNDEANLGWSNPKIIFNPNFFNSILKGIELEQEVYNILKNQGIPENKILVSTRVLTGINDGWGTEIDILFVDKLKGKIKKYSEWSLWAIEVKNQEAEISLAQVRKFHGEVSPITKNLIFVSKSLFGLETIDVNNNLVPRIRLIPITFFNRGFR